MSRPRLIALLLALGTLVVYLPVSRFDFLDYDDTDYVTDNSFVKSGLTATDIHWAFTAYFSSNWHPLTWMSHMLDCELFGVNPGPQHFVNVLWHSLNVALLFFWLLRLTGRTGPSAFMAALFAWHPLHVESVAWIAERKDVLSTFFALLTLLAYTRYAQEKKRGFLWLALGCFALGLMAKPMLVTLPCVLLLLDYWPLKRLFPFKPAIVLEKIPFFLLTLVSCVITFRAQKQGLAMVPLQMVPLPFRLENALVAIMDYLEKLFVPVDLCPIYPLPKEIPPGQVVLAAVVIGGISILAWTWRAKRPYFLMGWLWFLGTLVPVIGLVQVGVQSMADRYAYIPSIGFFIALILLLAEVLEQAQTPKLIATGFAAILCAACILATENQLSYWQNSETLFRHAIVVTRDNDVAHLNLGTALAAQNRIDEALPEFQTALRINPRWYQLHNNIGNILDDQGHPAEAAAEYRLAIRLDPTIPYQHNSLGITLVELGDIDGALAEFAEAERLDPTYPWSHVERARLYYRLGRDQEGVSELQKAMQLAPDNYRILATAARFLAADARAEARNGALAVTCATKANVLSDNSQSAVFDTLGMALAETGDYSNAVICAQSALQLANAASLTNADQIKLRLDLYQKNQPWHESFQATNGPLIKF